MPASRRANRGHPSRRSRLLRAQRGPAQPKPLHDPPRHARGRRAGQPRHLGRGRHRRGVRRGPDRRLSRPFTSGRPAIDKAHSSSAAASSSRAGRSESSSAAPADRSPATARALRRSEGVVVEVEEGRRRDRGAEAAAHGRRVPARVVEGRMGGGGERAHRLAAGGVRVEDVAGAAAELGAKQERRRRRGCAQVGEVRQVGVVEVEHVPRRPGRCDPLGEDGAHVARRPRGGLVPSGRRRMPASRGRRWRGPSREVSTDAAARA
jgi:hypothetical protein